MGFCDPCAAPPLSQDELRQLGVFWLDEGRPGGTPFGGGPMAFEQVPVMLTRLHVRYSAATFPEDSDVPGDAGEFPAVRTAASLGGYLARAVRLLPELLRFRQPVACQPACDRSFRA